MRRDATRIKIREHLRNRHTRFSEVDRLVEDSGVTRAQARELIKRYGNDRHTLLSHARNLCGTSRLPDRGRAESD